MSQFPVSQNEWDVIQKSGFKSPGFYIKVCLNPVQPTILSLRTSIVRLLHLLPANMDVLSANFAVDVKQECVAELAGDNSHGLLPQKVGRFPLRKLMTKHRRKVNINYLSSLNTKPLSHSATSNQTTAQLFQAFSITETLRLFLKAACCLLS